MEPPKRQYELREWIRVTRSENRAISVEGTRSNTQVLRALRMACEISKATRQAPHADLSVSTILVTEDSFGSDFDSKDAVERNICSDNGSHNAAPCFLSTKILVAKDLPPKDKIEAEVPISECSDLDTKSMITTVLGDLKVSEKPAVTGKRADNLYALGVVLYEVFAGTPPFQNDWGGCLPDIFSKKPQSMAGDQHAQKRERRGKDNKLFTPLRDLGLPVSLCRIVSNLIDSEETKLYSSVAEVEEDLTLIASNPNKFFLSSHMETYKGKLDFARDKIYDRTEQFSRIANFCERATEQRKGREMITVSGHSGVGKSSLVGHIGKYLTEKGGCFIHGKFDEMHQTQPLSAIVDAFNEFCDLLLNRHSNILEDMKISILKALGTDVKILVDVIQNLSQIVGTPSVVPLKLEGREAYNRLKFCFQSIMQAISSHSLPIVLFLDDMQWADHESLDLMQVLVADANSSLLCIGSYRDDAVDTDHPLKLKLEHFTEMGVTITDIKLENIDKVSMNKMISDTLHVLPRMAMPLSNTVYRKTGGNPLFVIQFLHSLNDEGLLHYSLSSQSWEWDINVIESKTIANNVADLMVRKMRKLSQCVQLGLKVAACFGRQCGVNILKLLESSRDSLYSGLIKNLDVAVDIGLMIKVGPVYLFSHDQIQNAAYTLIPEIEQDATHLQIGRLIMERISHADIEGCIYHIANQLNRGSYLIIDKMEKIELIKLNLMAGEKAMAISAFLPASTFLLYGVNLIEESDWKDHYELCLQLLNCYIEAFFVLGIFSRITIGIGLILDHSRCLQDSLRAYNVQIKFLFNQKKIEDATKLGISVLGMLGEAFSSDIGQREASNEHLTTTLMLDRFTINGILHQEESKNKEKIDAMQVLRVIIPFIFFDKEQGLFVLVICRSVQLTLCHGAFRESSFGFACYGYVLINMFDDLEGGYRFGKLALSFLKRYNAKDLLPEVHLLVYGYINIFFEPLQACQESLLQAYNIGLVTGNLFWAMSNSCFFILHAMQSGHNLNLLAEKAEVYLQEMKGFKQNVLLFQALMYCQVLYNLIECQGDPSILTGKAINQEDWFATAQKTQNGAAITSFYFFRMWLAFLFRNYKQAAKMEEKRQKIAATRLRGGILVNEVFYRGLVCTSLAQEKDEDKSELLAIAKESIETLDQWANKSPWNFLHKLELLRAEVAYSSGEIENAAQTYDRAIFFAAKHGFIHEQALACERTALFSIGIGNNITAIEYLNRSHELYLQWGSQCKARDVLDQIREIKNQ